MLVNKFCKSHYQHAESLKNNIAISLNSTYRKNLIAFVSMSLP